MKLVHTLKIVSTLILARTFGQYINSGWNGEFDYVRYRWRGRDWCIPLTPFEH